MDIYWMKTVFFVSVSLKTGPYIILFLIYLSPF